MKRITGLLLASSLSMVLSACGGGEDDLTPNIPKPDPTPPSLSADVCYLMSTTKGRATA